MTTALEEIGLTAVDRFITTWNSRDAAAWAASLNFPHVRPAPAGQVHVAADAAEYISRVDYNRVIASGWDHSEWDYKHVLHTSASRIHVVGQWSRVNTAGEIILTNPVVYIVTRLNGHWGVQSRFSADYAGDEDTTSMESRAFKLIEQFVLQATNRNTEACASLLNYPHFTIGVGRIDKTETPDAFSQPASPIRIDAMQALQTGRRSINVGMDITLSTKEGPAARQAVVNVIERDSRLGILAWSMLDPNEIDEDE